MTLKGFHRWKMCGCALSLTLRAREGSPKIEMARILPRAMSIDRHAHHIQLSKHHFPSRRMGAYGGKPFVCVLYRVTKFNEFLAHAAL